MTPSELPQTDEQSVTSLQDFLKVTQEYITKARSDEPVVFRGHRDVGWRLLPTIARYPFTTNAICTEDSDDSAERRLFLLARSQGASVSPDWMQAGHSPETAWKQLLIAQHHGFPTRLLDWSMNPLVGLFFALEGRAEACRDEECEVCSGSGYHDSVVYGLHGIRAVTIERLAASNGNELPPIYGYRKRERPDEPGLIWPPLIDGRISAQKGMFTISNDPTTPISPSIRIRVPHQKRGAILRELENVGINRMTLFPDLDGVADYLKWKCVSWDWERRGIDKQAHDDFFA